MLFKTRVGLCVLGEYVEIRAIPPTNSKTWAITAQYRGCPDMEGRSLLGRKFKMGSVWFYLAMLNDQEGVGAEIELAMQKIAEAYASSAKLCDLSQVGSPDAWLKHSERWRTIRWP